MKTSVQKSSQQNLSYLKIAENKLESLQTNNKKFVRWKQVLETLLN